MVTVIITMMSAALGLTCKDAFLVFSQQETLQLQRDNTELKARLAFELHIDGVGIMAALKL